MSVLQIRVKDNKFILHNDVKVESFTHNCVIGNGWKCEIYPNGTITCIAAKTYFDVKRQMRFVIKNRYAKLMLKIGNSPETTIKSYRLNQWPLDGVLRLSSGYIDKRKAYFREIEFQDFLDEYGITAVRYESANAVYKLTRKILQGNTVFEEKIETDGKKEIIFNEVKYPEGSREWALTECKLVELTEATWAIKTSIRSGKIEQRILYTMEKPQEIVGLSKGK